LGDKEDQHNGDQDDGGSGKKRRGRHILAQISILSRSGDDFSLQSGQADIFIKPGNPLLILSSAARRGPGGFAG
jgi:hypothetical protein